MLMLLLMVVPQHAKGLQKMLHPRSSAKMAVMQPPVSWVRHLFGNAVVTYCSTAEVGAAKRAADPVSHDRLPIIFGAEL
jgi:hypothetical protein